MFKLQTIHFWKLHIPLKVAFKHAAATRDTTESIWAEVTDEQGGVGYGESCPRAYVTGETLDSCHQFFLTHRQDLLERITTPEDLREWAEEHRAEIDQAPAAWCAIELAVLDLFARRNGASVETLLGLPGLEGPFHYTAILGDQEDDSFRAQLRKYRDWGFEDFKVKLSGNPERDALKMSWLSDAGVLRHRVRVDANNLWASASEALAHLAPLASGFFAVEEPLKGNMYDEMRLLNDSLRTPVILDESFLRAEQFARIDADASCWWINLRVSKMGGLFRSIEIAKLAAEKGIRLIVGAQVGETSLLTRAALTVAQFAAHNLNAQEGAYGTLLLQSDVTEPPLMFKNRGRLGIDAYPDLRSPIGINRPNAFLKSF